VVAMLTVVAVSIFIIGCFWSVCGRTVLPLMHMLRAFIRSLSKIGVHLFTTNRYGCTSHPQGLRARGTPHPDCHEPADLRETTQSQGEQPGRRAKKQGYGHNREAGPALHVLRL
ncbi:hypothetical protein GOODEAATRI_024039, partial [Goodea atripinnis]